MGLCGSSGGVRVTVARLRLVLVVCRPGSDKPKFFSTYEVDPIPLHHTLLLRPPLSQMFQPILAPAVKKFVLCSPFILVRCRHHRAPAGGPGQCAALAVEQHPSGAQGHRRSAPLAWGEGGASPGHGEWILHHTQVMISVSWSATRAPPISCPLSSSSSSLS